MIDLNIVDVANTPTEHLRAVAAFLLQFAEGAAPAVRVATGPAALIAAADVPSQGAPYFPEVFPAAPLLEVIADPLTLAASVFGAPAVPNAPSGAPFIAGAGPLSTAPAVPPVTLTAPTVPLPPVPSSAPGAPTVAATVPAAPPAPGVEVDADGLPYDARIHSGGRSKTANGKWKMKRGIDDAVIASVTAELRGVMAIPVQFAQAVAWPFPTRDEAAAPLPPVAPPAPAPASPSSVSTFPQLVAKLTAGRAAGSMNDGHIKGALEAVGVQALPLLAMRADLIPTFVATLDRLASGA